MNLAHIHLLLNHFPTVGTIIGIGLFLVGLAAKSDDLKKASLVVFLGIALITLPTYMSGNAAQEVICKGQAKGPCTDPGVSKALIEKHEGAALLAFAFMEFTGAFAWLGLWQFRRSSRFPPAVLGGSRVIVDRDVRADGAGGQYRRRDPASGDPGGDQSRGGSGGRASAAGTPGGIVRGG